MRPINALKSIIHQKKGGNEYKRAKNTKPYKCVILRERAKRVNQMNSYINQKWK